MVSFTKEPCKRDYILKRPFDLICVLVSVFASNYVWARLCVYICGSRMATSGGLVEFDPCLPGAPLANLLRRSLPPEIAHPPVLSREQSVVALAALLANSSEADVQALSANDKYACCVCVCVCVCARARVRVCVRICVCV